MKLTLTNYSRDGLYRDVRLAEVGLNCPYAIKIQLGRFVFTIYRWSHPSICISLARHGLDMAGAKESWAQWVLWQDRPFGTIHFWRREQ